jgi:hypothetical protein
MCDGCGIADCCCSLPRGVIALVGCPLLTMGLAASCLPSSSLCVRCLAAAALGEGPLDVGEAPGLAAPASDPRLAALALPLHTPPVSGGRSSNRRAARMPRRHAPPRPTSDPTTRFLPRRPPAAHAKSKCGISTRTHSTHTHALGGGPAPAASPAWLLHNALFHSPRSSSVISAAGVAASVASTSRTHTQPYPESTLRAPPILRSTRVVSPIRGVSRVLISALRAAYWH